MTKQINFNLTKADINKDNTKLKTFLLGKIEKTYLLQHNWKIPISIDCITFGTNTNYTDKSNINNDLFCSFSPIDHL